MPVDKNTNIQFTMSNVQLSNLLKKMKDLTTIDQRIMMRIDRDKVLLFSFVGDSFKNIHAFKNYIFPIDEVMTIKKGEIDEPIFFISKDGKKLYRILENFLIFKDDVKCKLSANDENIVNYINFDNIKASEKIIGSDPIAIGTQISIEDIDYLMDISKSEFNFRLDKVDFHHIKKRGLIENEPKSVLYINVIDKKLTIGETKWHFNIIDADVDDITLAFPKSYFNTMNPSDFIDIYVFEEFILCKYDDYNLMILMETSI